MKCEYCEEKATVHIKQVLKDQEFELHLCDACAEERGITDPAGFSLSNLLGGNEEKINLPELKLLSKCPSCEFSFEDLKKVGRVGCPECYEVFSEEIETMLPTMHRGSKHVGRRPEGMFHAELKKRELEKSKSALALAISEEDFEKAASLRDAIIKLEGEVERL